MADIFELFKKIEKNPAVAKEPTFIIVGLGNPGKDYTFTRHNVGFLAIDYICQKYSVLCNRLKFKALIGEITIGEERGLLMKPQTFMNLSGEAVGEAARFYKIPPERILVISDDINLSPGKVRIRKSGSAGGHNGLKNIIEHLSSDSFARIRIGVGEKPTADYDLADWVLSKIPENDQPKMFECFDWIFDICKMILSGDIDGAMCKYNGLTAEGKK